MFLNIQQKRNPPTPSLHPQAQGPKNRRKSGMGREAARVLAELLRPLRAVTCSSSASMGMMLAGVPWPSCWITRFAASRPVTYAFSWIAAPTTKGKILRSSEPKVLPTESTFLPGYLVGKPCERGSAGEGAHYCSVHQWYQAIIWKVTLTLTVIVGLPATRTRVE